MPLAENMTMQELLEERRRYQKHIARASETVRGLQHRLNLVNAQIAASAVLQWRETHPEVAAPWDGGRYRG